MTASVLQVHRFRTEYVVARDHPAPERLRADLDGVAADLPSRLATGLATWFAARPDEVVLIERLALECEVDVSRDPGMVADRWAYRIARSLVHAVESGDDGVLRFRSPAEYRARFIVDRALGQAAHVWYYRPFAGLACLTPAAAIRTVLTENVALGRETLRALPTDAWPALAHVLTAREVDRILDALGGGPAAATEGDIEAMLVALRASEATISAGRPTFVRALHLFTMALGRSRPAAAVAAPWARVVAALPAMAAALPQEERRRALLHADAHVLARADPTVEPVLWDLLSTAPPSVRLALARAVDRDPPQVVGHDAASDGEAEVALAGLALLVQEIDTLLDPAVCASLPPAAPGEPRTLAAWRVLAACAGEGRAGHVLYSSFWRDFLGVPRQVRPAHVEAWLAGTSGEAALERLAARATTLARGAERLAVVRWEARPLWLRVDDRTSLWLGLADQGTRGGGAHLSCSRHARRDLDFLEVPRELPATWRLFFMQAAQIAQRRLAYRLPGFAGCSLPYLHANVLAGSGRATAAGGKWDLRLTRPPLLTLLNLTGIARAPVRWSGPPTREIRLEYVH